MSAESEDDINDGYLCYQTRLYLEFFVLADQLESFEEEQLTNWLCFTAEPEIQARKDFPQFLPESPKVWYFSTQTINVRRLKSLNPEIHIHFFSFILEKKMPFVLELIASNRVKTHFNLYFHLDVRDYPTGPFVSAEFVRVMVDLKAGLSIYSSFVKADQS